MSRTRFAADPLTLAKSVLILTCVFLMFATTAVAQNGYQFVEIARGDFADPTSPFSQFQSGLAINENGTVVFRANLDSGAQEGLFTGSGGATTTIVTESQFVYTNFLNPTVSDGGVVLFGGGPDSSQRTIYGGSGGGFTTYGAYSSSGPHWFGQVINRNGTGLLMGGIGSTTQLYLADGISAPTLLYDASTLSGIGNFFSVDLNESNTMAAIVGPGLGQPIELVVGDGGSLITIVDGGDGFGNLANVSINNLGEVSFGAESGAFGPEELYQTNGGTPTLIADLSGAFAQFNNFGISLNDDNDVAFWAQLDTGDEGIFFGADAVADKLIGESDALFGSTVTSLHFERFNLNNSGQLVFRATLANGDQVIVRADPVAIPEPTGIMFVAAAFLSFGFCRRRRNNI